MWIHGVLILTFKTLTLKPNPKNGWEGVAPRQPSRMESDFASVLREHSTTVAARVAADRAAMSGGDYAAQAAAAAGAAVGVGAAAVQEVLKFRTGCFVRLTRTLTLLGGFESE